MKAFDILAEQYRPMVLTYLRTLAGDHSLAEDLTQETFLAACRGLSNFRKGANFGAWLRGIARNKALEERRAQARRRIVADTRIIEGMEEVYATLDAPRADGETWAERLALIHDCIARLSGKLRAAVEEVYQRRRSLRDAARVLDTSYEVIAQRLSRARAYLRECMVSRLAEEVVHGSRT